MLELYCRKTPFPGNDEIHQLRVIEGIMGTPTPQDWPGLVDLPWYELIKPKEFISPRFRQLFSKCDVDCNFIMRSGLITCFARDRWLSPAGLDLAEQLLHYDPAKRATAQQVLEAKFFVEEEPFPALPTG